MEQALIGAGLGAVGSAVTGRNPLQGALLGGATGGLFGGKESLLGSKLFSSGAIPASQVGKEVVANSIDDMGMALNPYTGTYMRPESFIGASTPFPVFTGGQGVFSNAMDMARNAVPDVITSNLTPSNLVGVGNLLANLEQRPQIGASPISISARPGQAPQQYAFNTGGLIRRA